jgi:dTMP kinase
MEEALKAGTTLVVDRYAFSGVAFSAAKCVPGMDRAWCAAADVGLPAPDAVLVLTLAEAEAEARGGFGGERYERREMQRAVRGEFKRMWGSGGASTTWHEVDAAGSVEEVAARVEAAAADAREKAAKGAPLETLWTGPGGLAWASGEARA